MGLQHVEAHVLGQRVAIHPASDTDMVTNLARHRAGLQALTRRDVQRAGNQRDCLWSIRSD